MDDAQFNCDIPALGRTEPPIQWVARVLSQGLSGRAVKLNTHLHIAPRLRIRGAIPPLPNMRGAQGQ
jgi:hypothetical protein